MKFFRALAALTLVSGFASLSPAAATKYHFIKDIPIGGKAQWDYLCVEPESQRLFVSHGTKVEVIDLAKGSVIGQIDDTPGVHGIALAPQLGRAFVSNGKENTASVVDLKSLKTLMKVATGANPDAILFEPVQNEVYTFNGKGKSSTVFDAQSGKVVATIDLSGKPEFATTDGKGRLYVNLEDKSQVGVIDSKARKLINKWPIAPGEAASGMAIDLAKHRLFLGCDNKKMVKLDIISGKVVASVPIGAGVDACAFDPGTSLAFSSNGEEGTTTIATAENPDKLIVVQTLKTVVGARTMTVDPKTHYIYLPAPTPAFRVLVYGPEQ
ncbi:MAG TPA: YncE family protein [Verrucomicrobiae bacterium]|jgi:DNA-binding beta-propeller fold protein YncE